MEEELRDINITIKTLFDNKERELCVAQNFSILALKKVMQMFSLSFVERFSANKEENRGKEEKKKLNFIFLQGSDEGVWDSGM